MRSLRLTIIVVSALFPLLPQTTFAASDPRPDAGAAGGKPAPAGAVIMRAQKLSDPVVGKDAYSVLVPDKWKMQGAVTWPACSPSAVFDLSVADPAQHAAWRQFPRLPYISGVREAQMRMFPGQRADIERRHPEGSITELGFEVRTLPATPREYVLKVLAPRFCQEVASATDLKVVSETDLPDLAKTMTDRDPFHRPVKASRFRLTYTAADGPVERDFLSSLIISKSNDGTTLWIATATTCRAPAGKLDALLPTFASIESSVQVELPWFNVQMQVGAEYLKRQREFNAQVLQDQRDSINRQMKIMHDLAQQASDQLSDRIRENFANQQKTKAEVQDQEMNYINGTANFRDPNTNSLVKLSSDYRYQYISNHGDVFQADDPTNTPPVDPSTSWKQMERVTK